MGILQKNLVSSRGMAQKKEDVDSPKIKWFHNICKFFVRKFLIFFYQDCVKLAALNTTPCLT
jgi:hypothetical protein